MKIIEAGVLYPIGKPKESAFGVMIYTDKDDLFYAKLPPELPKLVDLNPNDFHSDLHGEYIPPNNIYPPFDPTVHTVAPDPLPANSYVKVQSLLRYKASPERTVNHIAELVRHDARACETFKRNPHPNIAKYLGCQVRNDRILCLCFQKYEISLFRLVNSSPEKVNKEKCLEGVRRGIEHIHGQGYVHNDISPSNIMFDDVGNAIIIDFNSSRQIGAELPPNFGTRGYFREEATISESRNDYYGLEMIKKYLNEII